MYDRQELLKYINSNFNKVSYTAVCHIPGQNQLSEVYFTVNMKNNLKIYFSEFLLLQKQLTVNEIKMNLISNLPLITICIIFSCFA